MKEPKIIRRTLNLSKRTIELVITEESDRIVIETTWHPMGDFGDRIEIESALLPFIDYDADPRPISWRHPVSGQVATVHWGSDSCTVLIQSPSNLN